MTTRFSLMLVLLLTVSSALAGCNYAWQDSLTATPTPTRTRRPTRTLEPTSTPRPTPTVTLSLEEAQERNAREYESIATLVNTEDTDCMLPCWWGITPGQTTWTETETILESARLSAFGYSSSNLSSQDLRMYQLGAEKFADEGILRIGVDIYVRTALVNHINIRDYSDGMAKPWTGLAPERLVPALGIPSRIELDGGRCAVDGVGNNCIAYTLVVFYDEIGVYLHYGLFSMNYYADPICPVFTAGGNMTNGFTIVLKSPADTTPIENYDDAYLPGLSFETATGKTLEEFYQAYLQTSRTPCFYVLPGVFE